MFPVYFYYILYLFSSIQIISCEQPSDDNIEPFETQRAQCTVTAGEVKASAEATVSKKLEGVCGSKEMQIAFKELEMKLLNEIQQVKLILQEFKNFHVPNQFNTLVKNNLNKNPIQIISSNPKETLQNIEKPKLNDKISTTKKSNNNLTLKTIENKKKTNQHDKNSRDIEIQKLNNTMLSGGEIKLYSYYWKLEKFSEKIKSKNITEERSPIFTIIGKHLQIKALFNHLNRDFLHLQMELIGSNDLRKYEKFKSIILDTDNMFKHISSKTSFKHKITILDQTNPNSANDLISQEIANIDSGFLIPNSALLSSRYSKNDTILIKIIIYL